MTIATVVGTSPSLVEASTTGLYTDLTGALRVDNGNATTSSTPAGSTGADYSANAAAVPTGGYVLLTTIPANSGRYAHEVRNRSASTLQLVRDDGAGDNVTTVLPPGTGAGARGGGWPSNTFRGRLRVYGPSGSQVAAFRD